MVLLLLKPIIVMVVMKVLLLLLGHIHSPLRQQVLPLQRLLKEKLGHVVGGAPKTLHQQTGETGDKLGRGAHPRGGRPPCCCHHLVDATP